MFAGRVQPLANRSERGYDGGLGRKFLASGASDVPLSTHPMSTTPFSKMRAKCLSSALTGFARKCDNAMRGRWLMKIAAVPADAVAATAATAASAAPAPPLLTVSVMIQAPPPARKHMRLCEGSA